MKPDNKFFAFMSLAGDIILLNVLFIITSLPILTAGTSLTALYASLRKRLRGQESYIVRDYFAFWKENLKNSMIIWCILLPCLIAMLVFTSYIANNLQNLAALCVYFLLLLILLFVLSYAFPLQATFVNSPTRILLNSLLTALRHLPYTLALIFITSLPVCLTLCFPGPFTLPAHTGCFWASRSVRSFPCSSRKKSFNITPPDPRGSRQMDMQACPLGSLLAEINLRKDKNNGHSRKINEK